MVASGDQARRMEELWGDISFGLSKLRPIVGRMEELWEDISFGLSKLRPIAAVPLSEFSILLRPLERTKE
ncbi:hypothetical protein GOBAR_DD04198 [Gossypium barbadense]|nr:hypothetical protein GOBAR_DD04198 [Gossypium barbadense]